MNFDYKRAYFGAAVSLAACFGLASVANAETVDLTDNGTFLAPSITEGSLTVSGSNDVTSTNGLGLGIFGSPNVSAIDPGETMTFSFDTSVDGVFIDNFATVDIGGDGIFIEITLSAYDTDDLFITSATQTINPSLAIDVSDILGINSLSSFDLDVIQEDGLRIRTISFPEPSSGLLLLAGSALLALLYRRHAR
jgi:hypothetical protein